MTDASKALAWLVARLGVGHFTLLDCNHDAAPRLARRDDRQSGAMSGCWARRIFSGRWRRRRNFGRRGTGRGDRFLGVVAATEFEALDRLLEAEGAAGAAGPAGQLIAQLGQTS
jgi:leucyl/phenylalanyl-tRNA--protein transferase